MQSFNISGYFGGSITIGNALGLATDPSTGNIYLTTLSYAPTDPNLWKLNPAGQLLSKTRAAINMFIVPGNPGSLQSAVIGGNGHLYICVGIPTSPTATNFSVDEVSLDGQTVYSSFPDYTFTRGGSGISYQATRQHLMLSSFTNKTVYEVTIQGVLTDQFSIAVPAIDIACDATTDSVFVLSSFLGATLIQYQRNPLGQYTCVAVYSCQPLGLSSPLALDINRQSGMFYIQDNNVRVVEFSKSELTLLPMKAVSGSIAINDLPPTVCNVTLRQAGHPDQHTQTDMNGNYSFVNAAQGVPFTVILEGY